MLYFLQQLLNGFHSGALYALLAFGYVLTNGVLKRTNLAYGPIFAFAGQVLILTAVFGWNVLWLTLPATVALGIALAFIYAALTATVLSRSVFIPLAMSLAQRHRRGDARRGAGADGTGASQPRPATSGCRRCSTNRWCSRQPTVSGHADRHPARQLRARSRGDPARRLGIVALAASGAPGGPSATIRRPRRSAASTCAASSTARLSAGRCPPRSPASLAALYYGNVSFGSGMVYGLKVLFVTAVGSYRDRLARGSRRCLVRHRRDRCGPAISRSNGATRWIARLPGGAAAHADRSGKRTPVANMTVGHPTSVLIDASPSACIP